MKRLFNKDVTSYQNRCIFMSHAVDNKAVLSLGNCLKGYNIYISCEFIESWLSDNVAKWIDIDLAQHVFCSFNNL